MAKPIDRDALVTLLGISAGMVASCSPSSDGQWQVCTDNSGRRVPDINCSNGHYGGGAYLYGGGWRYFSRNSSAPAIGEEVTGGSKSPISGAAYAAPEGGITRGGFGGFGEEGGGHFGAGE